MTEYLDDDLPLLPFAELFGEGSMSNKKKSKNLLLGGDPNGDETTGRWTHEEHKLFKEGIMLYGKDWKKMQPLIKTRTLVQIRTHAQKVFKIIGLKKLGAGSKSKASALAAAAARGSINSSQQMASNRHHEGDVMAHQNLIGASCVMDPNANDNRNNQHHYPITTSRSGSEGGEQQHGMTASMMMPLSTASSQHQHQQQSTNGLMQHHAQYYGGNVIPCGHDWLDEGAAQPDEGDQHSYNPQQQLHQNSSINDSNVSLYGTARSGVVDEHSLLGGGAHSTHQRDAFEPFPMSAMGVMYNPSDPMLGQFVSQKEFVSQFMNAESTLPSNGMFGGEGVPFNLLSGGTDPSTSPLSE